jgi:biotin synthase
MVSEIFTFNTVIGTSGNLHCEMKQESDDNLFLPCGIDRSFIGQWLCEKNSARIEQLTQQADAVRRASVGDSIYLRGLVEFSNICVCGCTYCGLRVQNNQIDRYRLSGQEILQCAEEADKLDYDTVVLQAGDDPNMDPKWLGSLISSIKKKFNLVVTLSVGEQTEEIYRYWRDCGAERYLLKFETSDEKLFSFIHPGKKKGLSSRIKQLGILKKLGYETGGGIMVGLPGQTLKSVQRDIELFAELELDMIGIGPYIPHPETPLSGYQDGKQVAGEIEVRNDALTTCKVISLARLVCPKANIPVTTALASIDSEGLEKGLRAGANVLMPNITPFKYRTLYRIYPCNQNRLAETFKKAVALSKIN